MDTKKYIVVGNKTTTLDIEDKNIVAIDDKKASPEVVKTENNEFQVNLNGHVFSGEIVRLKQNQCTVLLNGNTYNFTIETEKSYTRLKKIAKENPITKVNIAAMLPGLICDVMVEKGQQVQKGETLLVLEAMKMQNEILSPVDGTVTQIHIKTGDNVLKDQLLVEIDPTNKEQA